MGVGFGFGVLGFREVGWLKGVFGRGLELEGIEVEADLS